MSDIETLISRLEAGETGREIDAEIAVSIGWDLPKPMGGCHAFLRLPTTDDNYTVGTYWLVQRSGSSIRTAPHFITSLDAAMELVPDGFCIDIGISDDKTTKVSAWNRYRYGNHGKDCVEIEAEALTPETALTIACLKARLYEQYAE
jgi:hypothetical protein